MGKPPRSLNIRMGEFFPVVDAVALTKGLRGRIVGGKKRSARLAPADGGMTVEMFGSSTFVPVSKGTLDYELSVEADLLAGFLRSCTRAFHPAEIVDLRIGPDQLTMTCGTLKVTLKLSGAPFSSLQADRSSAARSATVLPREPEIEGASAEARLEAQDLRANQFLRSKVAEPPAPEPRGPERRAPEARASEPRAADTKTTEDQEFAGWRRYLVFAASGVALLAMLGNPRIQSAYYEDAETFLGGIIFIPILAGLFAFIGILLFDLLRSPSQQQEAKKWVVGDPARAIKNGIRAAALLTFLGCILLGSIGLDWLFKSAVFWIAAVTAMVTMFVW